MKKELSNQKTRKIIIIVTSILISLLILILIFCLLNNPQKEPDIVIGYSTSQAPLIIAKEKGYFNEYGLNAEFILFESSKYAKIALSTGQVDIVNGGATNYFDPISKGINLKIIAPISIALPSLYVRPNELHTFQDLNNKRYGMRIDSQDSFMLREILKENDLNININYVGVDTSYKILALMDKNIIDFAGSKTTESVLFLDAGAVLLDEFVEKGYNKRRFLVSSIIANGNYLEENTTNIDVFIDVYIKSHKFIKENPDEAAKIIMDELNRSTVGAKVYTKEEVLDVLNSNNYVLWSDPIELEKLAISAKEVGIITNELSLEDIYDNRYEEKLRIAQEEIYGQKN